ncbi:hypothetical protein PhCBS80983_g01388 [Powellomyces hirtus]|uniref:Cdc23 domain-containing protein n=1 Tax=Powellomyces hirtus TaxID=109895 RepID=A0A507EAJ5_9FUNG|nr:hypothetical protein PhCBS80983_g01388 [Powellomyces hirtus]
MAGISHSFLDTLNAPAHEVEELLRDGHPTPAGANVAYNEHHEWHGEAGFGDMWTGEGDEGLEDAEGEEYDEKEGEGDGGSAEVYEEGYEGEKADAQDGADEIPDDVGRQLDIATADAGISSQKHADILWEEDEEAMKEIHATVGSLDDDWEGIGRKKKRKKKVRRKTTELTEEQAEIVGQANLAYIEGEHVRAVSLLHKVIQDAPNAYQAWVTLAMLHDELGDSVKAMRTYMMAAHIDPKDSGLWSRLGALSRKAGHNEQAMYCFDRAIVAEPTNVDSRWDRAAIYHERGMLQKAIEDYNAILDVIPHNMPAVKELCKIYLGLNDPEKAITLFEGALNADVTNPLPSSSERDSEDEEHGEQDDEQQHDEEVTNLSLGVRVAGNTRIGYEELNMLAELYMDVGDYEKALVTIKQGTRRVRGETDKMDINEVQDDDSDFTDGALHYGMELPLELQVKLGICRLFLNNPDLAKLHFRPLYSSPVSEYSDLYHDVGEAYMQKKMFLSALHVFEVVKTYPVMDSPVLWTKMGQCHAQLGNLQVAMELFENVLEVQPEHATVKLELAAICEELGDEDRYHRLLAEGMYTHLFISQC